MYLLEHDAKMLLARHGVAVPEGCLIERDETIHRAVLPAGQWMIKGQIASGGRGKAGIIRSAATLQEISDHVDAILGASVRGHQVQSVRIEQQVSDHEEAYLGLLLDAANGSVRVIMSARGGVDVESLPPDDIRTASAMLDPAGLASCVRQVAAQFEEPFASALRDAGERVARIFLQHEALLIEINPLFVKSDGQWLAGDAKIITDDNALERQSEIRELLEQRATAYPEAALKLNHGFDYVVVDPQGELGLLTTGAGLSMMLIDELREAGIKPYNFLDIRTGGLRGETTRLVSVLSWIASGPRLRAVLVNIFAGITDLGEFSKLLVSALQQVPQLRVPVIARLVGNGLPAAREVLSQAGVILYTDLDEAVGEVRKHLGS